MLHPLTFCCPWRKPESRLASQVSRFIVPRSAFCVPRLVAGALVLLAAPILVRAQQPSSAQIQQALQQNPGLGDVLRQRIQQSGMTPEQIRGRLQGSGYPGNLLDAYFVRSALGQTPAQPP